MLARLSAVACPRCACHMVREFECNCGEVHGDHCVNCGRWVALQVSEHVELSEIDARCDRGAVEHDHSVEERAERITQFFTRVRAQSKGAPS